MAVNRFTKYTPREFVQTYDPYPIDKMMGLAQHQQRRFDQIDTAIGKAYSDAVIKPGLSVEGRRTAKAVNKERKEQLDNLVNNFAETRDVRGAVRGLSELSSNWQSDTRADFVNADRELMKPILNQTGQEGYGDYYTHKSYNPTTGDHTLGYTDEQIAAGVAPTMADYGAMSNPGSSVAFKTFIDPVKDVITQGMTQDPQGNWITRDGKYLDAQQFLDKAGADINKLSSDGWNIDQPSDADPQTQKFIKWRQKEFAEKGKVYTLPDFKDDFLTEAEKYTHNSNKTKVTKGPTVKDGINSTNSAAYLGQTNSTSPLNNQILSKEISEGGLDAYAKDLGYSGANDNFYASLVSPNNSVAKANQTKLIDEKVNSEYKGRYFNDDGTPTGGNSFYDSDGRVYPVKSKSDVDKEIADRKKQLSLGLDKAFHFRTQALNQMSPSDRAKIVFNDDGTYQLTPEAQKKLDKQQRAVDNAKDFMSSLGQMTPDTAGKYWDELSDEAKEFAKEGMKEWDDNPQGHRRFIDDPSVWIPWAFEKLKSLGKEYSGELLAVGTKAISDAAYSFTDNPIEMMQRGMDDVIKEHYGSKTYYNNRIHLQDKDIVGITTQVNALHQRFSGFAKTNFQVGEKTSTSGVELSQKQLETLKNRDNKEINFKGGEFNPEFIEFDFVGKGRFKVYATGHINKKIEEGDDKGDHRTDKEYQVDITQEFMNEMGSSEQAQLLYQDAILDTAYDLIPNGNEKRSVYLSAGAQEEAKEFFGGDDGAMISKGLNPQTQKPFYNITGKVAIYDDNNKIQIVNAETYLDSDGNNAFTNLSQEEMLRASRDIAVALPYLTQETTGASMTSAEESAVQAAGIDISDVESFEVGAFGLNTQTNGSAAKQVQIGFASTAEAIESPVDQLSPKDQIDYSSHLFVNGGSGWNEWDVTKKNSSGTFENATFNKALRALKGVPENPGSIIEALNTNAKTLELSEVNSTMITNIMSEFKSNVLQRKSNGGYSPSDIAKNNNMSDSMVAIAVAIAQSGLNSNAVDINQK